MCRRQKLKDYFLNYRRVLVAFSGGIDSAFLLTVAFCALGRDRVLAITALSASVPQREKELALSLAQNMGAPHRFIYTEELDDPNYRANGPQRCFYCKNELYSNLKKVAEKEDFDLIVNGANLDDVRDFRPGQRAAQALGIVSPLQELGFTKEDIRREAKNLGIPIWNKPASPCLASRVPYFQNVTSKKLQQIEKAENFLRLRGFENFRVRHHGDLARIEVSKEEMLNLLQEPLRTDLIACLEELGFAYVSLDLSGFKSGSMNKSLLK